uniref:Uncharacterized protein n=1 Tax=Timema poppense TaxID=170557 RepID=A0A7R9DIZ6_TIMPO|nr:unnamed protein product [Timema poppensis]
MEGARSTVHRTTSKTVVTIVTWRERGLLFTELLGEKETSLYVLDCVFSVTVIGSLVVFVWRGAWTILDIYLLPSSPDLSAWGSLILKFVSWGEKAVERYADNIETAEPATWFNSELGP